MTRAIFLHQIEGVHELGVLSGTAGVLHDFSRDQSGFNAPVQVRVFEVFEVHGRVLGVPHL